MGRLRAANAAARVVAKPGSLVRPQFVSRGEQCLDLVLDGRPRRRARCDRRGLFAFPGPKVLYGKAEGSSVSGCCRHMCVA